MTKQQVKILLSTLLILGVAGLTAWLLQNSNIAVLNPKGLIATQQRDLIITATLLTLIVVIPVFILTFFIAWKYRAGNPKAKYTPDWDHHKGLEFAWWAIPSAIILVLSVITWTSTHELDPYKPIQSTKKAVTIQVVALQWKWLFIYPEQNIATVNYIQFPEDTPINFEITADAPMNSFWIPQLGGQVYAMAGMKTKLHLMAGETGSYHGSSANLSGEGFSGMRFEAKATSGADFDAWVKTTQQSSNALTPASYHELSEPSQNNPVTVYSRSTPGLYDDIIMKFMSPHAPADAHSDQSRHEATP